MKDTSDIFTEWLVLGCQQGDKKAFHLLVKQWHPKIMSQAFRYSKNRPAAKDIAQETWSSVLNGISSIKDPARFAVWIHRIVYHKSVDWIRRAQKNRSLNTLDVTESLYNQSESHGDEVANMMTHLNQLPADQKMVLTLFYLEQHNIIEIAEILAIPQGTVKSRLYNARETLKKKLKQIPQ